MATNRQPPNGAYVFAPSLGQERLWFLCELNPELSTAYTICGAIELAGQLNRVALQQALNQVIGRHEALRTGLLLQRSELRQFILPGSDVVIQFHDLTGEPEQTRGARVTQIMRAEAGRRFQLDEPPLVRASVIRTEAHRHTFLIAMHHVITDAWSLGIVLAELATSYDQIVHGHGAKAAEPAIQYADFAEWQREQLDTNAWSRDLAYWRDQLAGLENLDLPGRRPERAGSSDGAVCTAELGRGVVDRLTELAAQSDATPFITALAAFQLLLARYTGQSDIAVGTVVANRRGAEVQDVVGFFANTLVLRAKVDHAQSFRSLLRQVREVCVAGYDHQQVPFAKVVEALRPRRDLGRSPLFQVVFSMQNAPAPSQDGRPLRITSVDVPATAAKFDLSLSIVPTADALTAKLEYRTAMFDAAFARQLLRHYVTLLENVCATPDISCAAVPFLDETDLGQLRERGTGPAPESSDRTVLDQFAHQVAVRPDAPAVIDSAGSLSYLELDRRANAIAAHLYANGVRRNDIVALCVDRSADLPAALLGILKAGAAYLPLDPRYPRARSTAMVEDARPKALLTQRDLASKAPDHPNLLHIDDVSVDRRAPAAQLPEPQDAAYVIYTSGSTGRPKGVRIAHSALGTFLAATAATPGLRPRDVLVAVTTIAFDIAALELFLPLTVGATVVVADATTTSDPERLSALIETHAATVVQATPSTWQMLLDQGWTPGAGCKLLCGGEALSTTLADRLLSSGAQLWNLYGPTEATIWASAARITDAARIGLGRPLAGVSLWILDQAGQPTPPGVPGELHIGGAGLAQCYLNRPGLTAERFVPDPFGGTGTRLYRTGDRCRYREDGSLEYLGRDDHQVKLRGHRIELGEIEHAVRDHPGVAEAAVRHIAGNDATGDYLAAYLVARTTYAHQDHDLTDAVRQSLRAVLPEYMVPAHFVVLDRMPLTANGKIDRKALPAPGPAASGSTSEPPATEQEHAIAEVFTEVLGTGRIGRHDNFFDLGGHSLMVTKLVVRLREQLGVVVSFATFFAGPTVAEVAKIAGDRRTDDTDMFIGDLSEAEIDALLSDPTIGKQLEWPADRA
ncbi:amino acid adenylation domain-containing protein [Actinocrispum sp. NPDC049592]|uniref:non-ribosomal peptide synthetase n=1 Tax=Actinocrispum sp. NPDC049592 TaxID=3154835 RepID=UPI0034389A2B